MNEGGPKFHTPTEEILAYWNKYPVVLASQSDFRKSQLESLGFSDVSKSERIPVAIEADRSKELDASQGIPSYYADDGRDIVRHIAGAKVQYILDHQTINSEAIVLGFDTAPLIWHYDAEEDDFDFEHLEKPNTTEEGRRLIQWVIAITAKGCHVREERIKRLQTQFASLPEDMAQSTIKNLTATLDIGTISVESAAAGSFPNNRSQVLGFSEEISLFSQTINEMRNDSYALEILGDKVAEIIGDRVTQISGGIDYTDSAIRDLLKLSELKIEILENTITGTDHYLGFSQTAFILLLAHARADERTI
jgi:Maf-like protein